jgi:hypothetical protein
MVKEARMKCYMAQLREIAAEQERNHKLRKGMATVKELTKQRELARRSKPLTDQITDLMRTLPPQLRERPRVRHHLSTIGINRSRIRF